MKIKEKLPPELNKVIRNEKSLFKSKNVFQSSVKHLSFFVKKTPS